MCGRRGLRPACVDARGRHCPLQVVRGWQTDSPAQYARKGIKHCYFEANWLQSGEGVGTDAAKQQHLHQFLELVLQWLADGYDVHFHCISPLFPSEA